MKDVVCGMEVKSSSKFKALTKNIVYYFCSESCQDKFTNEPDKYIEHEHKECDVSFQVERKSETKKPSYKE